MIITEAKCNPSLMDKLIAMSGYWESENSTRGYRKNGPEDIIGCRVFLAEQDGEILGYLLGREERARQASSVMADGTSCLEIEELYVAPDCRNQGIGRALFSYAERLAKAEGVAFITLSTATKDYQGILHFYIDELGMDFWSARLFKKL